MQIPEIPPRPPSRIDTLRAISSRIASPYARAPRSWALQQWVILCGALLAIIGIITFVIVFVQPARDFPVGQVVMIPEDVGVRTIAAELQAVGAIDSPLMFYAYARLTGLDRSLEAGPYVFSESLGIVGIAHRLERGEHGITTARVTLTEGMTVADMATTLKTAIPSFDTETFIALAEPQEGYLFPDTYFFLPNVTADEVHTRLRARFDEQFATLAADIEASGRSPEDIVAMASILEREANREEDMRIVAGILWNRIDIDMPLQVDAVFGYIRGVNGYTPTAADLAMDSPYNTYRNVGFPPTPISNPGLMALRAATLPQPTDYFYYLTGVDGNMYYGITFDDHRENRARYLDI